MPRKASHQEMEAAAKRQRARGATCPSLIVKHRPGAPDPDYIAEVEYLAKKYRTRPRGELLENLTAMRMIQNELIRCYGGRFPVDRTTSDLLNWTLGEIQTQYPYCLYLEKASCVHVSE